MQKNLKKTRIIATIGPASEAPATLEKLVRAGLDIARLNFSHGSHEEHQKRIDSIRVVEQKLKRPLAILADLAGPKIRTGELATETVTLVPGKELILTSEKIVGTAQRMSVNYAGLPGDVQPGAFILLNDGKQRLRVERTTKTEIVCTIIAGGEIRARRGVNVPGTQLSLATLTAKDKNDVRFAAKNGADVFALSFVQNAGDIADLRKLLKKLNSKALVMAKIETASAVEQLDAIIEAADAVMVARGDLAVEVGAERVPFLQKQIIAKARASGKIVVVATQMLESMIEASVPTRAEVSDVWNAILEGTDAVMLSAESAVGKFPLTCIETMANIASEAEGKIDHLKRTRRQSFEEKMTIPDAISRYAVKTAIDTRASAIVVLTESGTTARLVGRFRPEMPLVVVSIHEATRRQASFLFGTYALDLDTHRDMQKVIADVRKALVREKLARKNETIVLVAGLRMGVSGGTNTVSAFTI